MWAGDVMTRNVISVASDATAMQAAAVMLKHGISGVPIVDTSGILVGIVTEGDFLRRTEIGTQRRRRRWIEFLIGPGRLAIEYVHACGRKVREIMTPDPCTVTEATPLAEVVQLMEQRRIKRVPVVHGRHLVGIVSRADLLRVLSGVLSSKEMAASDDAEIRETVMAELGKQPWASLNFVDVIVRDGCVELRGSVMDDRARRALVVAAENVPGVKQVRDHLVGIDPMSGMVMLHDDAAFAGAKITRSENSHVSASSMR
jgi:CBS domain-containing protein